LALSGAKVYSARPCELTSACPRPEMFALATVTAPAGPVVVGVEVVAAGAGVVALVVVVLALEPQLAVRSAAITRRSGLRTPGT
jgi:hypothetical protein